MLFPCTSHQSILTDTFTSYNAQEPTLAEARFKARAWAHEYNTVRINLSRP